jgi:hypothetical protein
VSPSATAKASLESRFISMHPSSVSSVPSVAKPRCFEKPALPTPSVAFASARHTISATKLLDLADVAPQYCATLAEILRLVRAGEIPADRLQGLRTHAAIVRQLIDDLTTQIPAPVSQTANNLGC